MRLYAPGFQLVLLAPILTPFALLVYTWYNNSCLGDANGLTVDVQSIIVTALLLGYWRSLSKSVKPSNRRFFMTKQIPLSGKKCAGMYALVDDDVYEELSRIIWYGSGHRTFYAMCSVYDPIIQKYRGVLMHRLILDAPPGIGVDHIDGNGLHNTRDNLRLANQSQNNMNSRPRKNVSSRYKGVGFHRRVGFWYASIAIDGKNRTIGYFETERQAAEAYNVEAIKHFGEFARPNIIPDGDGPDTVVIREKQVNHGPKSIYRGVSWDKERSLWIAELQANKRRVHVGRFTDELEAAHAYDAAARIHHGAKAKLNFP